MDQIKKMLLAVCSIYMFLKKKKRWMVRYKPSITERTGHPLFYGIAIILG
jgi:hypothetical protein